MKCREVQRILTEEIQLAESAEVRKHLEGCQECRDLRRDLLSLRELSGELQGRTRVPRYFTERVCSRVSGRSRTAYWSLAATAAGLALLAIGIVNLAGLSTNGNAKVKSQAINGGERIQRIDHNDRAAAVPEKDEPDVFFLGEGQWESQETDRSRFRSQNGVSLMMPRSSSSGFVLELPATIEVRQTQAYNEFYLENVSH